MASDGDHTEVDQRLIPLAQIDSGDERFRITTRRDSADLQPSLQRLGLLAAPLVLPTEYGFIIVSGFRRVAACRELTWEVIPARVLGRQTSEYECALRAIAENSTERPLNLIETSRALALLDSARPGRPGTARGRCRARSDHPPRLDVQTEDALPPAGGGSGRRDRRSAFLPHGLRAGPPGA